MKFLIAGYGSIGRRHLRNLRQLGEEDICLYRSHRSTLPGDEVSGLQVDTDLAAALARHPDAVIVSNPTALHMDVAIPAAEAGCHLLLEKPISDSLVRMEDLENAIHHSGARTLVGFQYRFHHGLQKVKELLEIGAIGTPLSTRAHWGEYLPGWHPWEDYTQSYASRTDLGGGAIFTLCHPLDYLRWLLGEVENVWAFTSSMAGLNIPVEDTAEIGLRFVSGVIGSVHLDYVRRPDSHTLEITGTQGVVTWNNANGAVRIFRASTQSWESFLPPSGYERNDLFLAEMRHFLQVVRGVAQPVCNLNDGIRALALALAAYQSSQTGRLIDL